MKKSSSGLLLLRCWIHLVSDVVTSCKFDTEHSIKEIRENGEMTEWH